MFPEDRHKDDKRTGASVIWGEPVRAGTVLLQELQLLHPSEQEARKKNARRHPWMKRVLPANSNTKNEACRGQKWRGKTWGKYRDTGWTCRDAVRKVKDYLELNLAKNKNNFCKYASDKRKTRENVSLLLSVPRDLVTQGIVKAEVRDTVFTWVTTGKTGIQQCQALDTNGKIWNMKMSSWWKMIGPGNIVVPDVTHPKILRELPAAISMLLLIILKCCGNWEKHPKTGGNEMSLQHVTGRKEDPRNYRLVSLTSIPAKVTEHTILEMIFRHIKDKEATGSSQHGEILLNQPDYLLWWNAWLCRWENSSGYCQLCLQ